jgi:hypothetical protein
MQYEQLCNKWIVYAVTVKANRVYKMTKNIFGKCAFSTAECLVALSLSYSNIKTPTHFMVSLWDSKLWTVVICNTDIRTVMLLSLFIYSVCPNLQPIHPIWQHCSQNAWPVTISLLLHIYSLSLQNAYTKYFLKKIILFPNLIVSACILIFWIWYIPTNALFIHNNVLVYNVNIKTLKNAPTCMLPHYDNGPFTFLVILNSVTLTQKQWAPFRWSE